MKELNELLAHRDDDSNSYEGLTEDAIDEHLTEQSQSTFLLLPQRWLSLVRGLLDCDPCLGFLDSLMYYWCLHQICAFFYLWSFLCHAVTTMPVVPSFCL